MNRSQVLLFFLVLVFLAYPQDASLTESRLSIPAVSASELTTLSSTRIYLTAFQSYFISIVDPKSGHAVHKIYVESQQAGMAVSPDGLRLYVMDGHDYNEGFLRVFDTSSWKVIFEIPVANRAVLIGGNPLSLSGEMVAGCGYRTIAKTPKAWKPGSSTRYDLNSGLASPWIPFCPIRTNISECKAAPGIQESTLIWMEYFRLSSQIN